MKNQSILNFLTDSKQKQIVNLESKKSKPKKENSLIKSKKPVRKQKMKIDLFNDLKPEKKYLKLENE